MRCRVTGLETKNKWRGHPIHKAVLMKAKLGDGTLRKRLISLQRKFIDGIPKKSETHLTDEEYDNHYENYVIHFLKIDN